MATNSAQQSLRSDVSPEEWQTRVDLAAFYRIAANKGWDDLLLAHISARVPDEQAYLVNPFGLFFAEITASNLLKVDFAGQKLLPSDYNISPEANVIHGAVLDARPDVNCVAHVHTIAGTAVAAQKDGLLNLFQPSMLVTQSLSYHDYQGVVLDPAEAPSLAADLGTSKHMILRNHGLLTVGATVSAAFQALYNLQQCCEMQIAAQAGGGELLSIPDEAIERTTKMFGAMQGNAQATDVLWEAELRWARRTEPDFEH